MARLPKDPETLFGLMLGAAALTVVALQVGFSAGGLSPLETTLFGILQFVFSTAFAFVLARITTRREFQGSQKQFAIAAYRRIKEIEKAVDRLIRRIRLRQSSRADVKVSHELDAAYEIARGIRETITYAIADWGDVIGEEIVTVERIEELQDDTAPQPEAEIDHQPQVLAKQIVSLDTARIRNLLDTLPYSLRIMTAEDAKRSARESYWSSLRKEIEATGDVLVGCYFDNDTMSEAALRDLSVGAQVSVRYGDLGDRIGNLLVFDSQLRPVGAVLNNFPGDCEYDEFATQFVRAMCGSTLDARVTEVHDKLTESGHPCHFHIRVKPARKYWEEEATA